MTTDIRSLLEADMTPAQYRALKRAASRERGNICPTPGLYANAQQMLIEALDRRGFIEWRGKGFPYISDKARALLKQVCAP